MHGADTARTQRLFVVLAGFFVCNALIAEFIGVKVFALEPTLGIDPVGWNLYGVSGTLNFTAGVLLWPVVFVMTDVINEFFGRRGVRFISWLAVFLIVYAFLFAYLAIHLAPASFWVAAGQAQGVDDMQVAFAAIFGQGLWTIAGSVTAFAVGQVVDVAIYHRVRRLTGERMVWLRATGSTLVSQLVDSFIVLYIAFVLGPQQWSTEQWLAVGTVNYLYKALLALLLTPVIYGAHRGIEAWLGRDTAEALKRRAAAGG
jgi:queuosine precursor transporter